MASSYQLLFNGQAATPDLYNAIATLEVEENMDLPGAVQISLPVSRSPTGDLTYVSDSTLQPLVNVAVVVNPPTGGAVTGNGDGAGPQCIFDGYILSQKLHLESGATNCTLTVWGQDASWLMNLTETVKEWVDVTDADAANSIFGDYGITPDSSNTEDDSPSHTEDGHTLMQRASDIQFLRNLARRNGKICRIACADKPGIRTGYFSSPDLDGEPVATLSITDPTAWTVRSLDIEWDASRPSSVIARQALFTDSDPDGVVADTSDSGLPSLSDEDLADFTGNPMTVVLTAPVDDGGELTLRAQSLLREAGWFVRCEGESDIARLGTVLRVGSIVQLDDAGAMHSGKYLVWSVRHTIGPVDHTMKFVLVRNAIGSPAAGGAGGLAATAGAS
ncbi:MAG: phage late control D family protein [Steroidobacteraceae bacterium]